MPSDKSAYLTLLEHMRPDLDADGREHSWEMFQAMKDRDAYIIKNPATSGLFGTPADIGKTPAKGAAPAPAGGDASDLDALMVKHGGS